MTEVASSMPVEVPAVEPTPVEAVAVPEEQKNEEITVEKEESTKSTSDEVLSCEAAKESETTEQEPSPQKNKVTIMQKVRSWWATLFIKEATTTEPKSPPSTPTKKTNTLSNLGSTLRNSLRRKKSPKNVKNKNAEASNVEEETMESATPEKVEDKDSVAEIPTVEEVQEKVTEEVKNEETTENSEEKPAEPEKVEEEIKKEEVSETKEEIKEKSSEVVKEE